MRRALNLTQIATIANQVFSQQTADELKTMQTHFGTAYSAGQAIAAIAVGMVARIAGLEPTDDTRTFSPVDALVARGLQQLPPAP